MALTTTRPQLIPVHSDSELSLTNTSRTPSSSASRSATLSRRSRTRSRAKTLGSQKDTTSGGSEVGGTNQNEEGGSVPPLELESFLDAFTRPDSPTELPYALPLAEAEAPKRPPRSPRRSIVTPIASGSRDADGENVVEVEDTRPNHRRSSGDDRASSRMRKRGQSLPRSVFRGGGSSSDSSSQSPMTPVHPIIHAVPIRVVHSDRARLRDSVLTHQSATSSSLYPASTVSGTDSPPSPRSLVDKGMDYGIATFDPQDDTPNFDADDVSYRLQLLVKNNYFLPPAHAKPSLSDLTVANAIPSKASLRSANQGFLDLFRLGRSKSKPVVLEGGDVAPNVHILRTTSDSTTASGWVAPAGAARPPPHTPSQPNYVRPPQDPNRAGRVVVVREKMDDIIIAAKQAEQEMKNRAESRPGPPPERVDDVVDPTDAVDLPPAGAGYPFEVQGLIGESPDAAMLAEALCVSPGLWSVDSKEATWRRALLQEAVGLSLNGSPATSSLGRSTPHTRITSSGFTDSSMGGSVDFKTKIGQRIVDQPLLEELPEGRPVRVKKTDGSRPSMSRSQRYPQVLSPQDSSSPSRLSMNPPRRAETPATPTHPLAPPPRRPAINPLFSLSQTDLSSASPSSERGERARVVRKSMSSPMLSDAYESEIGEGRALVMTPPPPLPRTMRNRAAPIPSPLAMGAERRPSAVQTHRILDSMTSGSHYSDDDQHHGPRFDSHEDNYEVRASLTSSAPTGGRPSYSDYSQPSPSPTASAFKDALYYSDGTDSPLPRISIEDINPMRASSTFAGSRGSFNPPHPGQSSLRNSFISPPPRSSSMSIDSRPISGSRPSMSSLSLHAASDPGHSSGTYVTSDILHHIVAPPPTTPPLPSFVSSPTSSKLVREASSQSLRIPSDLLPPSMRTTPIPSSPIDFFDHIQTHPNALDDLDTSDEESDDEQSVAPDVASTSVYLDSRSQVSMSRVSVASSRPSLMRLGNHSTPQLSPSIHSHSDEPLPTFFNAGDRKKPISNVPPRGTFFSRKKVNKGAVSPLTFQSDHRPSYCSDSRISTTMSDGAEPRSVDQGLRPQQGPSVIRRESILRFDGMLSKHMEAEKDVMKRIASNVSSSKRGRDNL
ncbi:hypothetical protein JAAARDRAFT_35773 [Jaapia argillacea MUCL 33604]|uniref:Uncharacterized protein n=1 Tax=Jaapia argillacea MUCL 33604 TaxID=933084 RepID=A0A067Q3K7_9AGAM|nr:hypothetical protein JAAARDRAFT_35773 [Jaapia argillacea MUCL 33604]